MVKLIINLLLMVLLVFSGYQAFKLYRQKNSLEEDLAKINSQLNKINDDNEKLQSDLAYFHQTNNLEKELKSHFNYVHPEEKMFTIIPKR